LNILQVCSRYYPEFGGIEEQVRNISEKLARNHEVTIATTDSLGEMPKEDVINGVKVTRFKSWAPNDAYYFSKGLRNYLVKNSDSFDVVHSHNYHALPALYAAQAKRSNKLITTPHYHGTGHTLFRKLLHVPYKFWGKTILEKADKVVCVSNYERDLVMKKFKVGERKIVVVPNGLNAAEFKGLRRRSKSYRTILYVGRLEKYKGVNYTIEILPRLDNDIVLEIVGKGPFRKHLKKLVARLGLEDRVSFLQDLPRDELLQKYADADLFALLSEHEAYGICVLEALACGTRCIVADASALSEWVDNENCYGIDNPMDFEKLANLVNSNIGKSVKRPVYAYDWREIAEKLVSLYESC